MKASIIECRQLSHVYSGKPALSDVNVELAAGEPIGLVGPNGAGKITLLNILSGFLLPTYGAVKLFGYPPGAPELIGKISALPQDARLDPSFTIGEQLVFYGRLQGTIKPQATLEANRVLESVSLTETTNEKPTALSHGMAKRVAIAQALIGNPELILLDEPTAGLDPVNVRTDVTQNTAAFLAPFPKDKKLDILDLGCGPGRDVKYFQSLGHRPVGLDGSEAFCEMARKLTGCEILQQTYLNLDLPSLSFDGIFANAALFHVPSQELPRVLDDLQKTLRPGGILFQSNPRGDGEGWSGQRYGNYMQIEAIKRFLEEAGFEVLDYFYRPSGKPRHEQPWLAVVATKPWQ